jgi:hypothetical protein
VATIRHWLGELSQSWEMEPMVWRMLDALEEWPYDVDDGIFARDLLNRTGR